MGEWEGLVHRDIVIGIGIGIDYRDPSRLSSLFLPDSAVSGFL